MNFGPTIFLGVFLTFGAAWLGLIAAPFLQLDPLKPVEAEVPGGTQYPLPTEGTAAHGLRVYLSNGCMYCHSQQIRPEGFGADIARGWGPRRTVARDYIYDRPHVLGTMRTGPDLTNIGARNPSKDWHHRHLYDPQITSPGSNMPPFRFLYEKRQVVGQPSKEALKLEGKWALEPGWEVVPTEDARALVAYLTSLDRTHPVPEAEGAP